MPSTSSNQSVYVRISEDDSDQVAYEVPLASHLDSSSGASKGGDGNSPKSRGPLTFSFMGRKYILPPQTVKHFPYTNPVAVGFILYLGLSFLNLLFCFIVLQENNFEMFAPISMLIGFFLFGMATTMYITVYTTPPGSPPPGYRYIAPSNEDQVEYDDDYGLHKPGYCDTCQNGKPERAHHCRKCQTCVLRMDHHCPWVHNCIGFNNHKYFVALLTWGKNWTMYMIMLMAFCCYLTLSQTQPLSNVHWTIWICIFLGLPMWLWTSILSRQMIYGLQYNLTTLETLKLGQEMSKGQVYSNPYDSGDSFQNFASMMGHSIWEQVNPFIRVNRHDGLEFPKYTLDRRLDQLEFNEKIGRETYVQHNLGTYLLLQYKHFKASFFPDHTHSDSCKH